MSKRLDRGAGILLPISSLPSPYGIGTLGKTAYKFVDKLGKAGRFFLLDLQAMVTVHISLFLLLQAIHTL